MGDRDVLVIIPALDEEGSLPSTLERVQARGALGRPPGGGRRIAGRDRRAGSRARACPCCVTP